MSIKKALIPVLACVLISFACAYIVLPEGITMSTAGSKGWNAVVTNVGKSDAGDLHIDITIRNDTADWSAMHATEKKPAVLTASDGKTTNCDTVFVGTGGHRLAPGFQIRGYTTGTKAKPTTQLIYVECKGAEATPGSKLSFDYVYYTGEFNYYESEANKTNSKLELNLDQVGEGLKYPVAEAIEGLIKKPGDNLPAINDFVVTLADATRTENGMELKWKSTNPSEYNNYVHLGNPPVIGEDGIIYGLYESPDMATPPITPPGATVEWTTNVPVPKDIKGLYVLASVENKQSRTFTNYAIDITDK